MLKQILSVSDVKKLKMGDELRNHPDPAIGKTYFIKNISGELIYAVHEKGHYELMILRQDEIPATSVWFVGDSTA